jgi:hypothetical protein
LAVSRLNDQLIELKPCSLLKNPKEHEYPRN